MKKTVKNLSVAFLSAIIVFALLISSASAKSVKPNFEADGAVKKGETWIAEEGKKSIELTADITEFLDKDTKENGGEVTVSVKLTATDGAEITQRISVYGKAQSGSTVTVDYKNPGKSVKLRITATLKDDENVKEWGITVNETDITCKADVTASPSASASPTPTATADEKTPEPAPSETATATATATPTKKPSMGPEKTNDPYNSDSRVTNAPPTLPPDIDADSIATLQPTDNLQSSEPDDANGGKINSDPTFGFVVLFVILVLLLAADVAAIIWRKKMGCGEEINGGVSRRKIGEDLCDYPDGDTEINSEETDMFDNDIDE